ncbi:hypothetical protein M0657_005477 [Pyricularia oryzae]|uniref:Uncharacterized protein n=3 Tax=Pyricularia oryzae TaxID=318829 RepID=A0A4P7NCV7_PYROR|nr:hypothetical protein OOU_Y34scaffold00033g49 [Pyricularia oryzae Y34]KAI7918091.1 hypothetical protein M9X92_007081 [Pyricularia oryzae]KAI7922717.1 hypothetical protein M0657_005477 [Pyricularia oryzae]QBZ59722.1 hypothetical protein PoMZ_04685 [Pyricularia oryzae]
MDPDQYGLPVAPLKPYLASELPSDLLASLPGYRGAWVEMNNSAKKDADARVRGPAHLFNLFG